MAKILLKSVLCFVLASVMCIGLYSESLVMSCVLVLGSVFTFGCLCVNGWLDDLMDFVEEYEKRMLG